MHRKVTMSLLITGAMLLPSPAGAKKHAALPEEFAQAPTVFVETAGGNITDLSLNREDREAILDVQDGIEQWGRYSLSRSRLDADLILVIRKGRSWRENSPVNNPPGSHGPALPTPIQGPVDASNNSAGTTSEGGIRREFDQLGVYLLQANGKLKGPIWSSEVDRGLDGPRPLLLQRLKIDVEKAYPAVPANKPPAP